MAKKVKVPPIDPRDAIAIRKISNYSHGAAGAMVAIPVPGVDMAATYAVWGKMIHDIARVYGEDLSMKDARALAVDLFKGVILTTFAWFGSAKTATTVLKFIPGAGTVTAYLVDAIIAGFGAKKITTALGFTVSAYFKSGREVEATDLLDEIAAVLRDPSAAATLLAATPTRIPEKKS